MHGGGVIVWRVCWVCEDSAVVIQMFCCRKGIWEENERWALMGSKGRSGIIGFDYICLSEQGRLNRKLELFWHCHRASKILGSQNGKNQTGIVASSSMWRPCGRRSGGVGGLACSGLYGHWPTITSSAWRGVDFILFFLLDRTDSGGLPPRLQTLSSVASHIPLNLYWFIKVVHFPQHGAP